MRYMTIVLDGQMETVAVYSPLVMDWDEVEQVFLIRADMMSLTHRIWHSVLYADMVIA